ncbi:transglycosylase family protein [Streptomyces sp. NPDC052079]|uniref:transglycosylase family protein n=1 Tax=Streptomyces sp. NPDC052079 TaxID=3155526 RepID=UPI0034297D13
MLSGNGRHRRPRQAPALLVAAGVTGSAIAIPLLAAGSASAADGSTWDRVAECESGGSWSENSGNGYYGGLQLTQDDWEKYGGLDYAPSADQASRNQQIAVAEAILADQGVGAWRTCGLLAGLEQNAPAADVDTGTSASPDSGDASASASPSATADPSSGADGKDKTPEGAGGASYESGRSTESDAPSGSDGGDKSADVSASPSATPDGDKPDKTVQSGGSSADSGDEGTGRHRGAGAEEGEDEERASESSGRHARGLDAWGSTGGSYTVDSGDNLSSIADSLAVDGGWRALYAVNAQLIGADPDYILPGQELEVGTEAGEK